jgi:hypothetical protein
MTTLTSIKVDLDLMSQNFNRKMKTVRGQINGVGNESSAAGKKLQALFGAATIAGFGKLIKGSLDAANRLDDLSTRLGTTAEGLSRLQYAAKITGVNTATLEMGLQRMTRRVSEAANGTGEAVGALNELGLSASKLEQASPEDQFKVLADALEKVPQESDKVRLAMKLLDSEGVALIQTMKGGSAAINALGEESDRTGATISTKFAKQATEANAALKRVGAVTSGLVNIMTVALAPTLESIANFMSGALPVAINFVSKAFNGFRATLTRGLALIVEGLRTVTYNLSFLSPTMQAADDALKGVQDSLNATADTFTNQVLAASAGTAQLKIETGTATASFESYVGATESAAEATKRLTQAKKEAAELEKSKDKITGDFEGVQAGLLSEEEALIASYAKRQEIVANFAALDAENQAEAGAAAITLAGELEQKLTDIKEKETAKRDAVEKRHAKTAVDLQRGAVDAGISLLKNLTAGNEKAAKAIIIVETALNIARSIQNTAAASVRALAELGPVLGPPAAAKIATYGAIQTGIIAANGALQLGAGGGGGSASPPSVSTASPSSAFSGVPAAQQSESSEKAVNQFIFNGDFNGVDERFTESLAYKLRDFMGESEFIMIESDSGNARELLSNVGI